MQDSEINFIIKKLEKVIPFIGISNEALLKTCKDLGLENAFCKFQNGIYSALEYILEDFNHSMASELQSMDLDNIKLNERVKLAIKIHLLNYTKLKNYREFLKKVLSFFILPQNIYFSNQMLYKISDVIWHGINDQSIDFNYYTKRVTLAGLYLSILLIFIEDHSENFIDTLSFLDRRIKNIVVFHNLKKEVKIFFSSFFNKKF
ncbi:COQ9 family protein [Wolbachia endosymbiont of Pentidionis agamae]|uniref:COQ9 family protein n=1 Tax=Wolbachia endosymbiont of Pentidionis agamae TaxID=3110435 RepID=UPI002FD50D4E